MSEPKHTVTWPHDIWILDALMSIYHGPTASELRVLNLEPFDNFGMFT